ncbi:YbaB/EbfC family nucleoid-associated protein [Mycoplasma sp. Ms02]|uniref:YbaB/EbfC family nucleoid-associated protein n=1 Tax=Mycoplasma sp. Ms02 TaxID=353851 RepID=UPI001C8B051B|nr:YbaB/EbfC family nucleoid-associated protein [Mycoplasma sp. Ms02]QZE12619.1 YbaB/EbfC family nucleoid-associated protein [Mycoplasma sp. Ms02]
MNPEMIKRLKKLQSEMELKQKELEKKEFKVEKHGVNLVMLGDFSVSSIKIDESLIDPEDKELLEDLLVVALNEAIDQIQEAQEALAPSMPGMPF